MVTSIWVFTLHFSKSLEKLISFHFPYFHDQTNTPDTILFMKRANKCTFHNISISKRPWRKYLTYQRNNKSIWNQFFVFLRRVITNIVQQKCRLNKIIKIKLREYANRETTQYFFKERIFDFGHFKSWLENPIKI